MLKRVFAWILLVGFVFLMINILFLGFYRIPSMVIYVFIALVFVFAGKKKK